MSEIKRLRVFAGPNGSGKSTLFESFKSNHNPGIFINSDLVEKDILEKGFIDLKPFGLTLTQDDLINFLQKPNSISLLEKTAEPAGFTLIDDKSPPSEPKAPLIALKRAVPFKLSCA